MKEVSVSFIKIKTIVKKELAWYFNNPGGFVLIALFIGFGNFLFFRDLFINGNATLLPYFQTVPWLLIFLTAGIAMRSFAEEKRNGTFEVLVSLPLTEWELVLGKFLAALLFVFACFIGSLTLPLTLIALSKPDLGTILSGYLGLLLFSAALLSIGIFISALTKNQVVSLLSTLLILFLLIVLGDDLILQQAPTSLTGILSFLSFSSRLSNFSHGVIDLRDVIFFLTTTFGFIFLSVKITENRG